MITISPRVAYYREILNIGNTDITEILIPILVVSVSVLVIGFIAYLAAEYLETRKYLISRK